MAGDDRQHHHQDVLQLCQGDGGVSQSTEGSLEYQRQLAENGSVLSQAIEASKGDVKDMLEEFRKSTNDQKYLIFEVFDRVARLKNLVISVVLNVPACF